MEVGWEVCDFHGRDAGLHGGSDTWMQENPFDMMNPNLYEVPRHEGATCTWRTPHLLPLALPSSHHPSGSSNLSAPYSFMPWGLCWNVLPACH